MFKKLFPLLIFFVFLIIPQKAFAALVINEFSSNSSPEWVEIYNPDSSSVDLSNYVLRDSTSEDSHKIDLSGTISGNGFAAFDFSGSVLNNSGDTIRLLIKKEGGESEEDTVKYGSDGVVVAPGSSQSAGRIHDGSSTWSIFSTDSKGKSNDQSATPTPTPTNTPASTNTPTPTRTPTPAPSATPTKSPTATPTKAAAVTTSQKTTQKLDDPTPTNDPNSNLSLAANSQQNDISKIDTPSPTGEEGQVLGISTGPIPWVYIGLGLIFFIVCGILAYFQFGEKIIPKFAKIFHGKNSNSQLS